MNSLILVVDDEPAMRESLAQALEESGHRVIQAANGRIALAMIADAGSDAPDLIVSDVMMPLLGGVGLCQALQRHARTARVPVILMSAVAIPANIGPHGNAFIAKPFDLDALDVLIESILVDNDDSGGETMNLQANTQREGTPVDAAREMATLQFRHDQKNSGVSRHGLLHAGEGLRIEYDPARLVLAGGPAKAMTDVVCHLRFQPSGEQHSCALAPQATAAYPRAGAPRPLICEVQIPT